MHYLSPRWEQPLIKVNCAALTESLLESELFGHQAGAFTGATRTHIGRFEQANGGTLVLDELGTIPPRMQEKILRVIEYGEFQRVGGSDTIRTDVRIVGPGSELLPDDGPFDVFLEGGLIADIAPRGALPAHGAVLPGDGGWLIPGLWDHHVHTMQWALVAERAPLGHATSAAHAASLMGEAPILDGRRVGTGFRDAFWGDEPTLQLLDAATGDIPTYLINADVHSVWLNTAALRREGFSPDGDGILREEPAFEISRRLNLVDAATGDRLVRRMATDAAARGVVGLVDLDIAWNEDAWARRTRDGFDLLRIEFGVYPDHLSRALSDGLRTGDVARGAASEHPFPTDPAHEEGTAS